MFDLRELYQERILEHSKSPRYFSMLAEANCWIESYNPRCGDKVTLYLEIDRERIRDIRFQGAGCPISIASASMLTERVHGRTRAEAEALCESFHHLVTGQSQASEVDPELGDLVGFAGMAAFPVRIKCATLAWHALRAVLRGAGDNTATT